jgi:DNA-directed RNA polymerase subunit RPC12/RpoP
MVKVIDETPDPKIVKQISCQACGVRLEYVPIEILTRSGHDYSGGPDGEDYIICPKCKSKVIIRSW